MDKKVEKVLSEVLDMPQQHRAMIVDRLISSLDVEIDSDVEVTWQREVQKRISEIEKGEVACMPWEEVRERLRGNSK